MRSKIVAALAAASLIATSPALAQTMSDDMEDGAGLDRSVGIGIFGAIIALGVLFIFLEVTDEGDDDGSPASP